MKQKFWPFFVITLLASGVIMNLVMLNVASTDPSFAVEENYYRKAVNWDKHLLQLRHNQQLQWKVQYRVKATSTNRLLGTVLNAKKQAISNATISIIAFHNARASQRLLASVTTTSDGSFDSGLKLKRRGIWEVRIRIKQNGQTFTSTERLQVGAVR